MSGARAVAVLSVAACLAAASALAAPALAATDGSQTVLSGTPANQSGTRQTSTVSQGNGLSATSGGLPKPTAQCLGQEGNAPSPQTPWAQRVLDYSSVWGITQGGGVKVAVIDSGVDANPQYDNRVIVGHTFAPAPAGAVAGDCAGHGTSVAGIIAAAHMSGVGFAGVAPQVTLISIKITNSATSLPRGVVAPAILSAVEDGAKVINLSLSAPNTPALQSAVNFALDHNVVVVASAGNNTSDSSTGPFYPADYPGVLSVGAVGQDGSRANFSDTRTRVTVTAPGVDVTSTFPGPFPHSYTSQNGTSFAAAFVSGVVALVRAHYPDLKAAQVVQRIRDTADGAAGPGTGNGLVNPVEALTAVVPSGSVSSGTGTDQGRVSIDRAVSDRKAKMIAMSVAEGAFGLAAIVIAIAVVLGAGHRRRWRPGGM